MTLEEQIRAMADARAVEVGDVHGGNPDWRSRTGASGRGSRRWLIAAAAVAALVVGGVVWATGIGEDDADTEVAGDGTGEAEFERWLPPGGVAEISHGSGAASLFFTVPGQAVGLVSTPADATDAADDDWTWISVGTFQPFIISLAESDEPKPSDGHFEYRVDDKEVLISSQRLTAADFRAGESALRAAGADVDLIAREIASWQDGLEVIYAGPATSPPTQVGSEPDLDGAVVWWIGESDPARFMASFRWLLDAEGNNLDGLFALSESGVLNQRYATFPAEPLPTPTSEEGWLDHVEQLLGDGPEVDMGVGELFGDSFEARVQTPASDAVERDDGTWTVRLLFDEPVTFRDGGVVAVRLGPAITLSFGLFEPGVAYDSFDLDAPLTRDETRLYVDAINRSTPAPEPTSGYGPDNPSVMPGFPCANNPDPTGEEFDAAVHIDANRTPLDLDFDGINDEILFLESERSVIARLQTGWTNWTVIDSHDARLIRNRANEPAAADLDRDGGVEFFVSAPGVNTGEGAQVISLAGCRLTTVTGDLEWVDIKLWGVVCAPDRCLTRSSCTSDGRLLTETTQPAPDEPLDIMWTVEEYTYADAVFTSARASVSFFSTDAPPDAVPTDDDTGVVDCSPGATPSPAIGQESLIRPECAGNGPPPDDSDPRPMVPSDVAGLDVDDDGFDDELISFVGDDGGIWFTIHFGDGNYTNAIPFWFSNNDIRYGLLGMPGGDIAAADLTGNGNREFFVGTFGNTGRSASPASVDGCVLRWILDEAGENLSIIVGVGGNSCAPTGCRPRVSCADGVLVTEITSPVDAFDADRPLSEVEVRWTTTVLGYADDAFVIVTESESTFFASDPPADAPDSDDGDVIGCSP